MSFEINPNLDLSKLNAQYRTSHRLFVPNFLVAEGADALLRHISEELDWSLIICVDGEVNELTPAFRKECGLSKERELVNLAYESAKTGFSFAYENSGYVPESSTERASETTVLQSFSRFVNSSAFIDAARTITGIGEIESADLQATRYRGGHFRMFSGGTYEYLGARRAVAGLCLTPQWTNAWGGKLLFRGFDGHVENTHTPCFNALSIFDVRQVHAISMVVPLPDVARYSIAAWLRTAKPILADRPQTTVQG